MDISGPSAPRVVIGGALLLVVAVAVAAVVAMVRADPAPAAGTTPAPPVAVIAPSAGEVGVLPAVSSLAVLRDWDRARARAWADGDRAALGRLYVPGSQAGAADLAMLGRWSARELRVEGMAMQVLAVELRQRTARRLVLVVTDRLVGAEAVGVRAREVLPQDRPTTRRLEFRRWAGRWRLAAVGELAQDIPSPARSTEVTSGSENS